MTKASDNVFPKIKNSMNTSDQAAPSDSSWTVYAKANGIFARSSNAIVGPFVSSAAGMTNPMTTTGDMIYSSDNSGTPARRAVGSNGQFLRANSTPLPAWDIPPGYEFDCTNFNANVSITATTEATAQAIVTAQAVTFDGSTAIMVEFFAPQVVPQATAGVSMTFYLYDGTSIGIFGQLTLGTSNTFRYPVSLSRRLVPSAAAHTYSIRAVTGSGTGSVNAGIGGAGQLVPGYIRITRA